MAWDQWRNLRPGTVLFFLEFEAVVCCKDNSKDCDNTVIINGPRHKYPHKITGMLNTNPASYIEEGCTFKSNLDESKKLSW